MTAAQKFQETANEIDAADVLLRRLSVALDDLLIAWPGNSIEAKKILSRHNLSKWNGKWHVLDTPDAATR